MRPEKHQLPIVIGIALVSAAAGAAVTGYPNATLLAIPALVGLSLIAAGITVARNP